MRAAGATVEEAPGALDGLHVAFNALRATDGLDDLRAAIGDRLGLVGPDATATLASTRASATAAGDPGPLRAAVDAALERVRGQLARTPVLLAPVAPCSVCDLDGVSVVDGEPLAGFALMAQCRAVSALRLPALSIPVGADRRGLPLSVQVVAGEDREDLVLAVALALERALGGSRQPPWL